MGTVVADVRKGGGVLLDVGNGLCHIGSGGTYLHVGDVGYIPTHWEDAGRLPPSGGPYTDGTASKEEALWDMVLPPTGEGNGGGVHIVGGDIRNLPLEHSRTIYCDKSHYGPVSGDGADPWGKGVEAVVGSGGLGTEGVADGSSDIGIGTGVEGQRVDRGGDG